MKLYYISESTIPSSRANSVHVMNMCAALSGQNVDVELICMPGKGNTSSVFDQYGIENYFKVKYISLLGKSTNTYVYAALVAIYLLFKNKRKFALYSRSTISTYILLRLGFKVYHEAHTLHKPNSRIGRFEKYILLSNNCPSVIVITKSLKKAFLATYNIKSDKIYILPDAATENKSAVKKIELKGQPKAFKLGYVGSMNLGKGIDKLAQLSALIHSDTELHIIGGTASQLKEWKPAFNKNTTYFYGQVPYSDTTSYIDAMDVCLLPNQEKMYTGKGHTDIGSYTSPLKLFEYMCRKKPVIASDLEVLREVLNETNSVLVSPNNTEDWQRAIVYLRDHPEIRTEIAAQAYQDFVTYYTWDKRAKNIIEIIKNN